MAIGARWRDDCFVTRRDGWAGPIYLLVTGLLIGPCSYGAAVINTIDCGSNPARCEPAVYRAANGGVIALIVLTLVVTMLIAVRRRLARPAIGRVWWFILGIAPVAIAIVSYVMAREAVDAQYGH
jgi:hypothetical protein